MTPSKPGRGRPKGSGLNDAAQLRAIAGLMAADPDLKPTTAIKTLGITDPSVIRRLRDKYWAVERQLIAEIAPQLPFGDGVAAAGQVDSRADCSLNTASKLCARALPLQGHPSPSKSEPMVMAEALPTSGGIVSFAAVSACAENPARQRRTGPSNIALPSQTELPPWMGVGLSLYALSCEAQFAVIGTMFQWPPVAAVLASQVAFTELAIAMSTSVVDSSRVR
jgi:hypothetical protein